MFALCLCSKHTKQEMVGICTCVDQELPRYLLVSGQILRNLQLLSCVRPLVLLLALVGHSFPLKANNELVESPCLVMYSGVGSI